MQQKNHSYVRYHTTEQDPSDITQIYMTVLLWLKAISDRTLRGHTLHLTSCTEQDPSDTTQSYDSVLLPVLVATLEEMQAMVTVWQGIWSLKPDSIAAYNIPRKQKLC